MEVTTRHIAWLVILTVAAALLVVGHVIISRDVPSGVLGRGECSVAYSRARTARDSAIVDERVPARSTLSCRVLRRSGRLQR